MPQRPYVPASTSTLHTYQHTPHHRRDPPAQHSPRTLHISHTTTTTTTTIPPRPTKTSRRNQSYIALYISHHIISYHIIPQDNQQPRQQPLQQQRTRNKDKNTYHNTIVSLDHPPNRRLLIPYQRYIRYRHLYEYLSTNAMYRNPTST